MTALFQASALIDRLFLLFFFLKYSADGNYEVRYKCNVLIYSTGLVTWIPPAIYQVFKDCVFFYLSVV